MSKGKPLDYTSAGVDIDAANNWLKDVRKIADSTPQKGVLSGIGGFGAQFALPTGMHEPILISATDGVGTKLKLALLADKHHGMGIDLVAMCANDIITSGAKPLYFLDYYATDKLNPKVASEIIQGISDACIECDMALIGGETAEMPGCYPTAHYDLAGFCVGVIERKDIVDGSKVCDGDRIIALGSSGVHANGFSLVRHILASGNIDPMQEQLSGARLVDVLLTPTKLYVKTILTLLKNYPLKAIAHITGGGIDDNLPRVLPANVNALISTDYPKPAIFDFLQQAGNVATNVMRRTFNMGIGMLLVVAKDDAAAIVNNLHAMGEHAFDVGVIKANDDNNTVVIYK
jgi:phosphoribosylformylglycinamidine cyclo-ligase